jgi:uncharacterized phage protein (TIGR01671 family)
MEREVKFRIYSIGDKTMRYPIHYLLTGWEFGVSCESFIDDSTIVYPDIVLMQYTGLKDKNGKEIYEGDVIQLKEYKCDKEDFYNATYQISYEAPSFVAKAIVSSVFVKGALIHINEHYMSFIEVIGSIYENPELLKD